MTGQTADSQLSGRAQMLFRTLVERYIRDGRPVGSRTLSRDSGLDLSPATIRNVMSDLEDMGLLAAPHTSAGRVPTVRGYRLFVDTMLKFEPVMEEEFQRLRTQLAGESRTELMGNVSALLSEVTHMAGLVTLPRQNQLTLRQVEFLPLSGTQVLVIMVVNEREVQNRIIDTEREYSASELQQAGNYLTELCAGHEIGASRERVLAELRDHRERLNSMMMAAIEMANVAFSSGTASPAEELLVAGQTNLMGYGELSDMDKLRHLFDAFNRKRDILHLLDQSLNADGVQIFIGEEAGYEAFDDCSVVTAPYDVDGETVGVLGVVGPTRMAYDRVIPIVDVTARLLGAALNDSH